MLLGPYVTTNRLFYNLVTAEIFHTSIGIPFALREVHEMVKMWHKRRERAVGWIGSGAKVAFSTN